VLQATVSDESPVQSAPPLAALVTIERDLVVVPLTMPLKQLRVHVDQSVYPDHEQLIAQ
jgi:hypothetical protein